MIQAEVQSLKTDKSSYLQSDKIIFTGTISGNDTESTINLEITGPQGNYIGTFTTTSNTNGTFAIILDTNTTKIKSEFLQLGTYKAIAFIKTRSTNLPISFYYSPIPPPPPRPFELKQIPAHVQNKTQIIISKISTENQSKVNSLITTIPPISKGIQSSQHNSTSNYQKSSNAKIQSQIDSNKNQLQTQAHLSNPDLTKQSEQQLQVANKNQIVTSQYDDQQKTIFIKYGITIATIIGIIILIIKIEGRKKIVDTDTISNTQESGTSYGVSYHPYSHDGVRIHHESCRHVRNYSQKGATRWFFAYGYQSAKSQAESISNSQGTYCKNAQCCLNRIINNTTAAAIFLSLFPFFGLLGGWLVKEYYPTLGKGMMYFGLTYGIIVSIWLI